MPSAFGSGMRRAWSIRMSLLLLVVLAVWSAPVSWGQSPGTGGEGGGGGNGGGNAPDWTFSFAEACIDNRYEVLFREQPPRRVYLDTTIFLKDGRLQVNGLVPDPTCYVKIISSDNLLEKTYPRVLTQIGNSNVYEILDIDEVYDCHLPPPVKIRIDLKDANGNDYTCPFRLTLGSEVDGTSCSGQKVGPWKFDVTLSWTYGGQTPTSLPEYHARMDLMWNPNDPFSAFVNVIRTEFNADGSYGWKSEKNYQVPVNFRREEVEPPFRKFAWARSCIAVENQNPWQFLLPFVTRLFEKP